MTKSDVKMKKIVRNVAEIFLIEIVLTILFLMVFNTYIRELSLLELSASFVGLLLATLVNLPVLIKLKED